MKKYFVNGKEVSEERTIEDELWLKEMSNASIDGELATAWSVDYINHYRTWLERVAIMTLITTVPTHEACILDIERLEFTIKQFNRNVEYEKYEFFWGLEKMFIPTEVLFKSDNDRKIVWRYGKDYSANCVSYEISWKGYKLPMIVSVDHQFVNVAWEKRNELVEYFKSLQPFEISVFEFFRKVSSIMGIKNFSLEWNGDEINGKGNLKVRVYGGNHHLKYENSKIYVSQAFSKEIIFSNPAMTFDEFEIRSWSSVDVGNNFNEVIEQTRALAESFFEEIQKL